MITPSLPIIPPAPKPRAKDLPALCLDEWLK
jgi:hypothetical protein